MKVTVVTSDSVVTEITLVDIRRGLIRGTNEHGNKEMSDEVVSPVTRRSLNSVSHSEDTSFY